MPAEIAWALLSEVGRATVRRIALPLAAGYSVSEVARSIGISRSCVERLVDSLAAELERRRP